MLGRFDPIVQSSHCWPVQGTEEMRKNGIDGVSMFDERSGGDFAASELDRDGSTALSTRCGLMNDEAGGMGLGMRGM